MEARAVVFEPLSPEKTMRKTLMLFPVAFLLVACSDGDDPAALDDEAALTPGAAAFAGAPAPSTGAVFDLLSPVFGLSVAPNGSLMAAQTFVGPTELSSHGIDAVADLPGVSDVAHVGRGDLFAITAGPLGAPLPGAQTLYRVSRGGVLAIADLEAFEEHVNPDQVWNPLPPESNPFNLEPLSGGRVLVADAAANAILVADMQGNVDWVAVLPPQPLPFMGGIIPAQPVATSVAVGPDGAYYAGELKGFPGTPGYSRVWRIEAGTLHTVCPSAECTEVLNGLTSIVDLEFGPDGTLYVVELDADGWFATETPAGIVPSSGGTVQACDVWAGTCSPIATGLDLPAAVAIDAHGTVWVGVNESIPGAAHVMALP
jgi:hypothetical protein